MSSRRPGDPIRVLHCPAMVGGNPWGLARAERELGLRSRAVSFEPVHPGYEADEVLFPRGSGRLRRELRRWTFLGRALRSFDVVHFNFGSSILPRAYPPGLAADDRGAGRGLFRAYARAVELRDVAWLRRAGKGIAVTYQGADARQSDVCRERFAFSPVRDVEPTEAEAELDRRKRAWIARFARSADRIYALNPDLLHVLPARAEFVPYAHVDPREWRPGDGAAREGDRRGTDAGQTRDRRATVPRLSPRGGPLRVVHAPTDRVRKGTQYVVAAVEALRAEGLEFEFELLDGTRPHGEARAAYERADLLVDQLLAGWYGGLAVEAMALGKPVVCYLREEDLGFLPEAMREELPLIRADPDSIADVLRTWLTARRERLLEVGARSRAYVERWHDPLKIAARMKADYEAILGAR